MKESSPAAPLPPSILLVDDNRHGSIARKMVLQEHGYRVVLSDSGDDALKALSNDRFDLVVTDFRMPRMNGGELIRRIREQSLTLPIILLSGYVDSIGLDEKQTGANVVLSKGANEVTHLLRAVSRLLNQGSRRKPPSTQRPPARAAKSG
ncbi:MAG: response regulator [Bryobacteraceae bacterium]